MGVHINGGPDLLRPSLESHNARYLLKVSFLHVTPGTECKTDVKGHRIWTRPVSGSDPVAPFQLSDLGKVTYPLSASVSLSVKCGNRYPTDPEFLLYAGSYARAQGQNCKQRQPLSS